MSPFDEALGRVDGIPGIGRRVAEEVSAEVGMRVSRFPSAAHLSSWARVCLWEIMPVLANRKAVARATGTHGFASALVEAARATSHTKDTYLAAQYHRLAARRGGKRAILAVAHTILVVIYHLLHSGTIYADLGGNYFDQRDR